MDEEIAAPAPASPSDPKDARAREIYTTWRNRMTSVPHDFFNRLEAESEHLIAMIRAHL